MKDYVTCDWPQCECLYDCERQDKHDEWLKENSLNQSAPPSLSASVEAEPLVTAHGGADTSDNAAPWGNTPREIQKRAMKARTEAIGARSTEEGTLTKDQMDDLKRIADATGGAFAEACRDPNITKMDYYKLREQYNVAVQVGSYSLTSNNRGTE